MRRLNMTRSEHYERTLDVLAFNGGSESVDEYAARVTLANVYATLAVADALAHLTHTVVEAIDTAGEAVEALRVTIAESRVYPDGSRY